MFKKYIICFLILSIINFTSCYYSEVISKKDVDEGQAQINLSEELYITTKDYTRYHFLAGNYRIAKDSLFGKGTIESPLSATSYQGSVAFTDIISFEQKKSDVVGTIGLIAGIVVVGILVLGLILTAEVSDAFNPN